MDSPVQMWGLTFRVNATAVDAVDPGQVITVASFVQCS